ncbi:NADH-quinone oxidoreductase subunit NuoF [Marinilabiliaceae bacterium ANBcel2]|nr:NADH-quinone oxidoreductase subunit NuoF [Marinilabiliaceae bacterium ANBcel2]
MDLINSPEKLQQLKTTLVNQKKAKLKLEHEGGRIQVKVSMSTCGIASGAGEVKDFFEEKLDLENINADIVSTGCMGYCYAEPTVEITLPGGEPVIFSNVDMVRAGELVNDFIKERKSAVNTIPHKSRKPGGAVEKGKQYRIALRNCGFINPEDIREYIAAEGYDALRMALTEMTPDEVIEVVKKSGLRGRGGGGFPTGLKWELSAKAECRNEKFVVCNADEGDPGAFMDRSLLEGDPHSILEAMALCGYSIGSNKGVIYIRAEYPLAIERLKTAITQAKETQLLGSDIMGTGFNFDIEIRYGAGAFVCGEETALIHSMEGLRGEPGVKPPFPAEKGYKGEPTNVNNVETFANIPLILLMGAEWFSKIGTEKSKGTKVFALAGKINNVGLIEVPMGMTLREVVFDIGGGIRGDRQFKAVQTGGPSGGCLTVKHLDTPIDYENLIENGSMMGSGGMIVMDEDDCMVAVARFYLDFTVEESCGKCAPCRIGNKRLYEILDKITLGKSVKDDLSGLRNLASVIKETSLCGLGQTSPNPVLSTMDNFYDEYKAHVIDGDCPAGQCRALMRYVIDPHLCVGCTLCMRVCPVDAVSGEKKQVHSIDTSVCIKCGACIEKCKFGAISLQ